MSGIKPDPQIMVNLGRGSGFTPDMRRHVSSLAESMELFLYHAHGRRLWCPEDSDWIGDNPVGCLVTGVGSNDELSVDRTTGARVWWSTFRNFSAAVKAALRG